MKNKLFNFISVDLVLDDIQNQEYNMSTQNSITLPEHLLLFYNLLIIINLR